MAPINVLIVDDSLVIRAMMTGVLEKDKGLAVVGAASCASEAARILSETIVDVVTLDIEMPGTSGLEYLQTLTRKRIPVVMLSGHTADGSGAREQALERGAYACFDKANAVRDAGQLLKLIKEAAQHRPAPAETEQQSNSQHSVASMALVERLIAEHGDGLVKLIAERVGFATLQGDTAEMAKWVAISRRVDEVLKNPARSDGRAGMPQSLYSPSLGQA
ncbi:response regulator [Rhizorhabdus argentea]|uniref:response regulator n=1 Tax=Rhizorhabdus argentea TaxID=1387174 RepID=UPI0030EC65B0